MSPSPYSRSSISSSSCPSSSSSLSSLVPSSSSRSSFLSCLLYLFLLSRSSSSSSSYRVSAQATEANLPPGIPTLTLDEFVNFTLPAPLNSSEIARQILLQYPLPSSVSTVEAHLPRFAGSNLTLSDSEARDQWIRGIVFHVIPGVILAVLTLVAWIGVCAVSCCRSCSSSSSSSSSSFLCCFSSSSSSSAPLLWKSLVAFSCLVAIVFSAVGLAYDASLTNGLTHGSSQGTLHATNQTLSFDLDADSSGGVTASSSRLLSDLDLFFVQFPLILNNLVTVVNTVLPSISTNLVDASNVVSQFSSLTSNMNSTFVTVSSVQVANFSCSSSTVCAATLAPFSGLIAQLNQVLLPVFDVIVQDVDQIRASLLNQQQIIDSSLQNAEQQVRSVQDATTSYTSSAQDVVDGINRWDPLRFALTLVVFILPFLIVLLYFFSAFVRRSLWLLFFTQHLLFFSIFVLWLVFALHLVATGAIADSCQYVDSQQNELPLHFSYPTDSILQACLLNTSLLTAVNFSTDITLAFTITLPDISSTEELFNLSSFSAFSNQVQNVSVSTLFGYDINAAHQQQDSELQALNSLTSPDTFTLTSASISSCNPQQYPAANQPQISSLRSSLLDALNVESTLNSTLSTLQHNVMTLNAQAQSLQANSDAILSQFLSLGTQIAPLLRDAQYAVSSSYCGALGKDYGHAKQSYCDPVLLAAGWIDLAAFVVALALIPLAFEVCRQRKLMMGPQGEDEEDEGAEGSDRFPSSPPPAYESNKGTYAASSHASGVASPTVLTQQPPLNYVPSLSASTFGPPATQYAPASTSHPEGAPAVPPRAYSSHSSPSVPPRSYNPSTSQPGGRYPTALPTPANVYPVVSYRDQ